jgi:hypothetical protein
MQNRDGGLWPAEPGTLVCSRTGRVSRQGKAHARQSRRPGPRCRFPAAARNVVPARRVVGKVRGRKEPSRNDSGCLSAALPCQPALVPSNRPRSFGGTNEGPLFRRLIRRNRRPLQEEHGRSIALCCSPEMAQKIEDFIEGFNQPTLPRDADQRPAGRYVVIRARVVRGQQARCGVASISGD